MSAIIMFIEESFSSFFGSCCEIVHIHYETIRQEAVFLPFPDRTVKSVNFLIYGFFQIPGRNQPKVVMDKAKLPEGKFFSVIIAISVVFKLVGEKEILKGWMADRRKHS